VIIPDTIRTAVHRATNEREVEDAQRARDAHVWGRAVRFRIKQSRRPDWHVRYATLANMARARVARYRGLVPGNKVERLLLDKAHRGWHNAPSDIRDTELFVTVLAIHHHRRNSQ
jgi:hypothetical protein